MSGAVGDGGCCIDGGLQSKWASAAAAAAGPGGGRAATRMSSDLDDLSIDADDADERYREEHEATCRGRTLQFLESNPLQVALYMMVLLDAVVVISEILLDLHAMRSQYREATSDLYEAMKFIKHSFSADLDGYDGDNIQYVLSTLRTKHALLLPSTFAEEQQLIHPDSHDVPAQHPLQPTSVIDHKSLPRDENQVTGAVNMRFAKAASASTYNQKPRSGKRFRRLASVIGDYKTLPDGSRFNKSLTQYVDVSKATKTKTVAERKDAVQSTLIEDDALEIDSKTINGERTVNSSDDDDEFNPEEEELSGVEDPLEDSDSLRNESVKYYKDYSYSKKLLKIAHILHYIGIGILGFFVIQVSLKIFGMGIDFFKKKFEIFDAIIVLTSFGLDLVFIEGIAGDQTEEAIALLIIFLLWRILRIVNGIMITSKKRQEFRIQILKRARRRAQKKIEYLEDDKNWKEREITNLRRLCSERGAHDDDIAACKPRRRTIFQKMDTSVGLSTIASLSLGVSMSMTGTGRTLIKTLGAGVAAATTGSLGSRLTTDRRRSFNQLFPVLPGMLGTVSGDRSRRASFVDILQYSRTSATSADGQTLQNNKRPRTVFRLGDQSRRDAEEVGGLNGPSPKRRNSAVDRTDGGRRTTEERNDQGDEPGFGKTKHTGEISEHSFRSQIPEVTVHAPDDHRRASQEQTTPNVEADDRSSCVVTFPGESVELLVANNCLLKTSLSLPQISIGQDETDLVLDSNGSLYDKTKQVESQTVASPDDVTRFGSNDVRKTQANCDAVRMKPENSVVTLEFLSFGENQVGNKTPVERGPMSLTDGMNPNTRSPTARLASPDDFTVLIVTPNDEVKYPPALANGDSCKQQQSVGNSNFEVPNSAVTVLNERATSTPLPASTTKPHASEVCPPTLGLDATHSNSFPLCPGNTNSRAPLLRAIGLAWSRSQELQPKDLSLSTTKTSLGARRRSAQCVCSKRHTVENLSK